MKDYLKKTGYFLMLPMYLLSVSLYLTERQMTLLIRTFLLGSVTAGICVLLSFFLAMHCVHLKLKSNKIILIGMFFLLPASIHVMAWFDVLLKVDSFIKTTTVLVLYYIPLVTFVLWLGLRHIDSRYLHLSSLYNAKGELKILSGLMKPYIVTMFSLVAILVMNDFSVPSLCQYPTYSMELHSHFSAHLQGALILALPLILLNVSLLFVLFQAIRQIDLKSQFKNIEVGNSFLLRSISYIPGMIFMCHLLMILTHLVSSFSFDMYIDVIQTNLSGLIYSMTISLVSAVIASGLVFLMYPLKHKYLLLVLLVIPPPLLALGLTRLMNTFGVYHYLLNTSVLLVVAHILRLMPILLLLTSGLMKTLDRSLILQANLYGHKKKSLKRIYIPMMMPYVMTSVFIGFAFSFNDIGTTIFLLPPGEDWISLRIYSYLHYGTTERIYVLGSLVVLLYLLMAILYYRLITKKVKLDIRNK